MEHTAPQDPYMESFREDGAQHSLEMVVEATTSHSEF